MIKVVGKDESAYKRITCRGCCSILLYSENEVKKISGVDYSGGPDGREFIHCPECCREVIIRAW